MTDLENDNINNDEEKEAKIQELREIITNAQGTISSATQLLAVLQETTPEKMPINQVDDSNEDSGQVVYGFFDGQIMIGDNGKQYPVPANYASKSKLVEGDKLKLNITLDNKFVYKQIGPVQRNYLIGLVKEDKRGNFTVQTPEKEYQVLLAAATYFKIEPNDEVTLIVPQGKVTVWGAIENVLQKNTTTPIPNSATDTTADVTPIAKDFIPQPNPTDTNPTDTNLNELTAIEKLEKEMEKEKNTQDTSIKNNTSTQTIVEEWESDIEQLKQEANVIIRSK